MRLLFVADGRSPIALNWMRYFVDLGEEVHLASTFDCQPELKLASYHLVPVALSGIKRTGANVRRGEVSRRSFWGGSMVGMRTTLRQWIGPLTIPGAAKKLQRIISKVQPDLVHAMRIPYEGMTAALATENHDREVDQRPPGPALIVSVWGNDFTLHAPATPLMRYFTRRALKSADAVHTDCHRDLRLAHRWGLRQDKPSVVLPGGGGVQTDIFYPASTAGQSQGEQTPVVVNPRGFRAYVRNDTFFRAVPIVLNSHPQVRFVCPTMAGENQAEAWVEELNIHASVTLLPQLSRPEIADLFRKAMIAVSPSEHDGTPNTLIESMACGCFPIAGDIESLREWITPGVNGMLVPPDDPDALAKAIIEVVDSPELRQRAAEHNLGLVAERAVYDEVMEEAKRFYLSLLSQK